MNTVKRHLGRCCFLLLLVSVPLLLSAQSYELKSDEVEKTTNAEAWVGAGVVFDVAKWCKIEINESARFRFEGTIRSYSHLHLNFPFNRYFGMGMDYTFILKNHDEKNSLRHRFGAYAELTFHPGRWRITLKERPFVTMRFDSINTAEHNKYDWKLRSKFQVQYNVPGKPLKPYISFELENTLNAKSIKGYKFDEDAEQMTLYTFKGNYISKLRPTIGIKYTPARNHHLNFFYRFDADFSRDYNITHLHSRLEVTRKRDFKHIIGVAYTFEVRKQ